MENIHDNVILTLKVVIPVAVLIGTPALYIAIKVYLCSPAPEPALPIHQAGEVIQNSSILDEGLLNDILMFFIHLNPVIQIFIIFLLTICYKTSFIKKNFRFHPLFGMSLHEKLNIKI